jgi:hypothetical protein
MGVQFQGWAFYGTTSGDGQTLLKNMIQSFCSWRQYLPKYHGRHSLHGVKIQKMTTNLNNNQQPP